jgi:PadR family transcriptional regulator PadR
MVDIRTAILLALMQGDSYGLEIISKVKKATGKRLILAQGRVYPILRELEADGLVSVSQSEPAPERAGRPRHYYRLTAEGRRAATRDRTAIFGLFALAEEGAK